MASIRPRRTTFPAQVVLDAKGAGAVTITARADVRIVHTRVTVSPAPGNNGRILKQPTALVIVDDAPFESSYAGSADQSATTYDLAAQDTVTCTWTGGDPGATATLYLRGVWL